MIKMRNKNKLILAWIAIILLLMVTAASSIVTSPNVNESILNDTENRIKVANATFIGPPPIFKSGIACYSYTIDHSHWTTPDETCNTTGNSKSYTDLADRTWYFHVRAKDNAGNRFKGITYLYIKNFY